MTNSATPTDRKPLLHAENVHKAYGHVRALRGATLSIFPGEIVALVGDNGAGKSTMAKVLSGEITPDDGRVSHPDSEDTSTHDAHARGIEVVYQDLALAPDLSIAENMFLGRECRRPGLSGRLGGVDRGQMVRRSRAALDELGVANLPSLHVSVRELSGGQQQAIAVARAVMWATRLVVMDEPTAALGVRQTAMVYETVAATAAQGKSVLVISHDIPKMLTVADRVVVMRHGAVAGDLKSSQTNLNQVVALMLGDSDSAGKIA
jgi:ABC-type sugar transport system ATPase subunit